jgi:hypothetical protein
LEQLRAQRIAAEAGKHKIIRHLAGDVLGKIFDQETRQRYLAALVALGVAPHQAAADLGNRFRHQDTTAQEVDRCAPG